jgi:catechol 2,3-dioxygenase-like lactoylglutathione lyase family enzyme
MGAVRPALTHIALHVRNLEPSVAFYRDWCGLDVVHRRAGDDVAWLAEPGRESAFVLVLIGGGPGRGQAPGDYSHLGFALASRAAVDALAARARAAGVLAWEPVDEPDPVGYFCGLRDPDGNMVEFSYGQPLGPGAPPLESEW